MFLNVGHQTVLCNTRVRQRLFVEGAMAIAKYEAPEHLLEHTKAISKGKCGCKPGFGDAALDTWRPPTQSQRAPGRRNHTCHSKADS